MTASRQDDEAGSPLPVLLWYWGRRGGCARYTLELTRALAGRAPFELHLSLSRQSELYDAFGGVPARRWSIDTYRTHVGFAARSFALPWLRRRFARYLADQRIRVVLCTMEHLWNNAVTGAIRDAGARYLLVVHDADCHEGEDNVLRRWMHRRDIEQADGLITLTDAVRDAVIRNYGFPADRIWTAPHGAFDYGVPASPRSLPTDRPIRLLFFGRILPYKGLDLLLDALPLLRRRFPTVELEVWGSGDLTPYRSRLAALDNVRVVQRWILEEEIPEIYARSDLCVLPYRSASQSGVVADALSLGVPLVATPVGGLAEQVRHDVNGIVAGDVSAPAIADAIAGLLGEPDRYARLSAGALRDARETFGWSAIADQVSDAVAAIAAMPPRRR